MCTNTGYSFQQTDSRGFPITQTPGPSFGMPPVNMSSPLGAPLVTLPPASSKPHQTTQTNKHPGLNYYSTPFNFYFDAVGYPYYVTPLVGDHFYYSITTDAVTDDNFSSPYAGIISLPFGKWIAASSGYVPDKAIVYKMYGADATFYCRSEYQFRLYYGVLTPHSGCFIEDQSAIIQMNDYEVLISP